MTKELEFKMPDGLIIRGTLEGNISSDNLVVMLHSGGYDRHERGVKEVKKHKDGTKELIYYNPLGNYDYLTNLLKQDYCILRIDQRNHGLSGKNIDREKLTKKLSKLNVSPQLIKLIIESLLKRDKKLIGEIINTYPNLENLLNRPPIKDLSFIQMKDDLKEVMNALPKKAGKEFASIDYVGTCMGTVVLGLYLAENQNKANSLTLFSPLYTFDYSFKNPPEGSKFLTEKRKIVEQGRQFRLGNAVEGPNTLKEIDIISQHFLNNIANLNIPIFCIQGTKDALIPEKIQTSIFRYLIEHRRHINETYYAIIDGVHCLYDAVFPSVLEAYDFIESNKPKTKQK